MADQQHLAVLKQGVAAWNAWRRQHPEISPDLSEADLSGADLRRANLMRANLSHTYLSEASLDEANLSEADLTGASVGPVSTRRTSARRTSARWLSPESGNRQLNHDLVALCERVNQASPQLPDGRQLLFSVSPMFDRQQRRPDCTPSSTKES